MYAITVNSLHISPAPVSKNSLESRQNGILVNRANAILTRTESSQIFACTGRGYVLKRRALCRHNNSLLRRRARALAFQTVYFSSSNINKNHLFTFFTRSIRFCRWNVLQLGPISKIHLLQNINRVLYSIRFILYLVVLRKSEQRFNVNKWNCKHIRKCHLLIKWSWAPRALAPAPS